MLTERQEEILDFVRDYQGQEGVPPSTREVARRFAVNQATATGHLQALARKGQLDKLVDGKWGLRAAQVQSQLFSAAVYGSIPAGLPAMEEQAPEETLAVDPAIFGVSRPRPHQFWFLRVRGDSMTGAHIVDGDLVALVRREPRPGDIVAALVDGTSTLKRYVREGRRVLLRAENPRYADIVPAESLESQGVVVGVIRRSAPAR